MGLSPAPIITTFPQASLRSRTVGCPESGSDLGETPSVVFLGTTKLKRRPACTPPAPSLLPGLFPCSPALRAACPVTSGNHQVPRAPSRTQGVTSRAVADRHHVGGRYPTVLATTGSCASPTPSPRLWSLPRSAGLCRSLSAPAGRSTFPTFLCESFPTCLDPYPGGSWGALTRFFSHDIGLPPVRTRSAPTRPVQRLQHGRSFGAAVIP